ncbi:MAG: hypothetical protein RL660_1659 [Bacteroidota bacterium]|jgi:type I restriction enzyme S subunit
MSKQIEYIETGLKWLGKIPSNYTHLPLKRLVSTKITDGPHETPTFIEDGIPFVSAEAVKDGSINFDFVRGYISKELDESYSLKCKPKRDDIFIVKSGSTTGKVAIVETDIDFNIWSPLALVRVNDKVTPRFLFHSLSSLYFKEQVEIFWSFGTQPNIGMNVIENLRVILPPIQTQHIIAAYLDQKIVEIDNLISKKQKLIDCLKEEKTALVYKAVIRGLNDNAETKFSGDKWLGDVPSHWEIKKIKYVSKVQGRVGFKGYSKQDIVTAREGALTIGAKHIQDNKISLTSPEYISWEKYYESPEIFVEKGQILVVQRGSLGKVAIVEDDLGEATINPSMVILKSLLINPKYLFYLLSSNYFTTFIQLVNASTAVPMISQEQLENLVIPKPSDEEMVNIVKYIEEKVNIIHNTIFHIEQEIELIKEYRTSLINEVVTGKITLN